MALVKRLAFVALALTGLGLEGCAQLNIGRGGGCNSCGTGGGLMPKCLKKLFHRRDVVVTDVGCEPGLSGPCDTAPGTIVPGPVITAPPADEVPDLAPAPSSGTVPSTGAVSPNKRTLFETVRPNGGTTTSRRPSAPRSAASPELASRPAPARGTGPSADDPLVNLPPVSARVGRADDAVSPPLPVPASEVQIPPASAVATPEPAKAPVPAASNELPATPAGVPVSVASGFKRFKVVERQLAAGSVPSEAGWAFLGEKGYKTVIDLRAPGEVQSGDLAAASRSGFRYIALPVTPETLNAATLNRFQEEITLAGSRPLLFFDNDGTRPSVLWYLRQVAIDKVDPADAAREAEEIGPRDVKYWVAAAALLESMKGATGSLAPSSPAPGPDAPLPTVPATSSVPREPAIVFLPDPTAPADPTAWRPYAALMVAGLGAPMAYIGRNAFAYRPFTRASLPAPARSARALPSSSDA